MMWPRRVDWKTLYFGVEIEFIEEKPEAIQVPPGWTIDFEERQIDETGNRSGAEIRPPRLQWKDRGELQKGLDRLIAHGSKANWSCGLHVHVGLEPWGEDMVLPLVESALKYQNALQTLLQTADDRLIYCPPVTAAMRDLFKKERKREALCHTGRPQAHRCGVNAAAWFDFGTVEFRFANGSLNAKEIMNTVELYLRYVAAVGANQPLPSKPKAFAMAIGTPATGYPSALPAPRWYRERIWLEQMLVPVITPLVEERFEGAEILEILPLPESLCVVIEKPDNTFLDCFFQPTATAGWTYLKSAEHS